MKTLLRPRSSFTFDFFSQINVNSQLCTLFWGSCWLYIYIYISKRAARVLFCFEVMNISLNDNQEIFKARKN